MSLLETYIKTVRRARGLHHQAALQGLRNYLKTTDPEEIISQIRGIYDTDFLRTLWEAGLKEPVRGAVLRQIEKLDQKRGVMRT